MNLRRWLAKALHWEPTDWFDSTGFYQPNQNPGNSATGPMHNREDAGAVIELSLGPPANTASGQGHTDRSGARKKG